MTDVEQYKAILGGDPKPIVDDLVNHQKTVPELTRWTGKVVNNDDPEKLGRCQVKVIGFYDSIPNEMLPWACPDIQYMGSKCGGQIIPEVDTMVRGYFDKGDVQRPFFDSVAFNAYNSESEYTDRKNSADYPHKMVLLETDGGDFLTLNRKDGTLVFTHRTGTMFMIDDKGNVTFQNGTNDSPKMNIQVNGDCNITVSGNLSAYAGGSITADAKGMIDVGSAQAKQFVCNTPNCFICGALHSTQQQVRV